MCPPERTLSPPTTMPRPSGADAPSPGGRLHLRDPQLIPSRAPPRTRPPDGHRQSRPDSVGEPKEEVGGQLAAGFGRLSDQQGAGVPCGGASERAASLNGGFRGERK